MTGRGHVEGLRPPVDRVGGRKGDSIDEGAPARVGAFGQDEGADGVDVAVDAQLGARARARARTEGEASVRESPAPRHREALTVPSVGSPSRTRMRPARGERWAWEATAETMGVPTGETVSRWAST